MSDAAALRERVDHMRIGLVPGYLDGFVGRLQELGALERLLGRARLVTLTGPAGSGKTRLAAELLTRAGSRLPDRTCWVELSALTQAGVLVPAVASALGVRERAGRKLTRSLVDNLTGGPALIVLDNCEHLIEPCADLVASLLARCPDLRVMATSRESLRVAGEVTFSVGPMSLPESDQLQHAPAVSGYEAVRLFVERAQECRPGFALTPANAALVAEICARLDGIPLAIELAARRVRILPVGEVHTRIEDRFALLTSAPRTAPARHHSLRAAVAWSYELLDPREQAMLRRLAVFVGGFGIEGATAVCAGDDIAHDEVLDLISNLEAKSLVVPRSGATSGEARFGQLETVRAFGLERLTDAGEAGATHERLAAWLTDVAQDLMDSVFPPRESLRRLDENRDNLLRAIEWATREGDERQLPLTVALARYWRRSGYLTQAHGLLENSSLAGDDAPEHRVLILGQLGWIAYLRGQYKQALESAEQTCELARAAGRPTVVASGLTLAGLTRLALCDLPGARADLAEAAAQARRLGRPLDVAGCLENLALAALQAGDLAEAECALNECITLYHAEDERTVDASALHALGALACERGDVDGAERSFRDSLMACGDDPWVEALDLEGLAIVAAKRSEPERAVHLISAVAVMRDRVEIKAEPWWERRVSEHAAAAHANLTPAQADVAVSTGRELAGDRLLAYALHDTAPKTGPKTGPANDTAMLTRREREVALLVAEGLTNRQIASRLTISTRTVDAHIDHIRTKLKVQSRVQIATWLARAGRPHQ